MSDGSIFSLADLGSSLGSLISGTTQTFKDQIAAAANNQSVGFSQSIINNLAKAEQDTSRYLGLSKPTQLVTAPAQPFAGAVQNAVNKVTGWNLSTGQILVVGVFGGIAVLGILWMLTRS